eukprot:SAG22_NODE_2263_length_2774_cov_6.118879_4_plen_43_part_00
MDNAFKQMRVMRVYSALCMCVLALAPASSSDDRVVSLAFEHA